MVYKNASFNFPSHWKSLKKRGKVTTFFSAGNAISPIKVSKNNKSYLDCLDHLEHLGYLDHLDSLARWWKNRAPTSHSGALALLSGCRLSRLAGEISQRSG
jgi:hypothetical protein